MQRPERDEPVDVDRHAEPQHRRAHRHGPRDALVAVAQHDDEVHLARDLRRELEVVHVAADPVHVERARETLRQVVDDDAVLCEDHVAGLGKLPYAVGHGDAAPPSVVGERPELGGADDDLVAEPLQVLAEHEQVHLGAARRDHVPVPEDEAHAAHAAGRDAITSRTVARQSLSKRRPSRSSALLSTSNRRMSPGRGATCRKPARLPVRSRT